MFKSNLNNPLENLSFFRKKDESLQIDDYSMGLTSRIFRVFKNSDVEKQAKGELKDGIMHFPPAEPKKIIRIYKKQFENFLSAFEEARKQEILIKYLGDHVVKSQEFITQGNENDLCYLEIQEQQLAKEVILLCGFQDYIEGEDFDLNTFSLDLNQLKNYQEKNSAISIGKIVFDKKVLKNFENQLVGFIEKIENMILKESMIPDLGGPGNIKITKDGKILLVDINNVHKLSENTEEITLIRNVPMLHSSLSYFYDLHRIAGIDPDTKDYFRIYFNHSVRSKFEEIMDNDMQMDNTGRC